MASSARSRRSCIVSNTRLLARQSHDTADGQPRVQHSSCGADCSRQGIRRFERATRLGRSFGLLTMASGFLGPRPIRVFYIFDQHRHDAEVCLETSDESRPSHTSPPIRCPSARSRTVPSPGGYRGNCGRMHRRPRAGGRGHCVASIHLGPPPLPLTHCAAYAPSCAARCAAAKVIMQVCRVPGPYISPIPPLWGGTQTGRWRAGQRVQRVQKLIAARLSCSRSFD